MILLRNKEFSRHTPKNLKKYERNSDEDIDKMSRGQRLRALEAEDETAATNTNKYVAKKIKKHAGIGVAGGAVLGAALGKGARAAGALTGAASGALTGVVTGSLRGAYVADKEGHNRDKRTKRLARRMDDRARKLKQEDDYEYQNNSRIKQRKTEEMARTAAVNSTIAAANTW